jgi:hypothetical protein
MYTFMPHLSLRRPSCLAASYIGGVAVGSHLAAMAGHWTLDTYIVFWEQASVCVVTIGSPLLSDSMYVSLVQIESG